MALNESVKRFPLSLSQLNILNLERVLAGTSVNNISTTVRISGRLDFPILQQSISLVVERAFKQSDKLASYCVFPVFDSFFACVRKVVNGIAFLLKRSMILKNFSIFFYQTSTQRRVSLYNKTYTLLQYWEIQPS